MSKYDPRLMQYAICSCSQQIATQLINLLKSTYGTRRKNNKKPASNNCIKNYGKCLNIMFARFIHYNRSMSVCMLHHRIYRFLTIYQSYVAKVPKTLPVLFAI